MKGNRHLFYTYVIGIIGILTLGVSCQPGGQKSEKHVDTLMETLKEPIATDWQAIKERGYLIVIIDNGPTSYFVHKGEPKGFEYAMIKYLEEDLGIPVRLVVETDIDKCFHMLYEGKGDIIAHNLTITQARKKYVGFTDELYQVKQVLVQRKPDNWRKMKLHEIERDLIRNPIQLIGEEVHVKKSSSHLGRLQNLSEEIGGDIVAVEDYGDVSSETLIRKVHEGAIDYTVADEDVASVIAQFYSNLDIKTELSFPQQIAWAVRPNSPQLKDSIDQWLGQIKRKPKFNVTYNRYFDNARVLQEAKAVFKEGDSTKISPYDDIIKSAAKEIGWDWRLLAAQIHRESRFDPAIESWAGAQGLMQLLPSTAKAYGAKDVFDPEDNIKAGINFIKWLDDYWEEDIPDEEERIKYILASYNVGQGHVRDAYNLTKKYKGDPKKWENVAGYLLKKSEKEFFEDPIVNNGYCRGYEPVQYVEEIFHFFKQYKNLIST